jgi:hypothetical protein
MSIDKQKVKAVLVEISNSMTRMDAEKEFIKDAIDAASKIHEIPKKTLNKMAKVFHKNNYSEELSSIEEFTTMYESIIDTASK